MRDKYDQSQLLGQKMKQLESQQEKMNKICEELRKDTLEPAEKQAQVIVHEAKALAEKIILDAEKEGQKIVEKAKAESEQERRIFQSSLQQSARQGVEVLRQVIETELFNPELEKLIEASATDPKTIAAIIDAIIKALGHQGLEGDLIAYIPKNISPQTVNALLLESVIKKLKSGSVEVGHFKGGAAVRLVNKKMTIDLTEETIKELLAQFIRKDFRKFIFGH